MNAVIYEIDGDETILVRTATANVNQPGHESQRQPNMFFMNDVKTCM